MDEAVVAKRHLFGFIYLVLRERLGQFALSPKGEVDPISVNP